MVLVAAKAVERSVTIVASQKALPTTLALLGLLTTSGTPPPPPPTSTHLHTCCRSFAYWLLRTPPALQKAIQATTKPVN